MRSTTLALASPDAPTVLAAKLTSPSRVSRGSPLISSSRSESWGRGTAEPNKFPRVKLRDAELNRRILRKNNAFAKSLRDRNSTRIGQPVEDKWAFSVAQACNKFFVAGIRSHTTSHLSPAALGGGPSTIRVQKDLSVCLPVTMCTYSWNTGLDAGSFKTVKSGSYFITTKSSVSDSALRPSRSLRSCNPFT